MYMHIISIIYKKSIAVLIVILSLRCNTDDIPQCVSGSSPLPTVPPRRRRSQQNSTGKATGEATSEASVEKVRLKHRVVSVMAINIPAVPQSLMHCVFSGFCQSPPPPSA